MDTALGKLMEQMTNSRLAQFDSAEVKHHRSANKKPRRISRPVIQLREPFID